MMTINEARERVKALEKKLNPKQRKFCDEILLGKSATEAAIAAGYSERSAKSMGSELRNREYIQDYLTARQDLEAAKLGISEGWVLAKAVEMVNRCMEAEPVLEWNPETREKEPNGTWSFNAQGAISALKLVGSIIGVGNETQVAVGGLEEYLRKLEEKR